MLKSPSLLFVFIFPILVMVYWQGLPGPLMLDDGPQLVPIMTDVDADNWSSEFGKHVLGNSGVLKRPVSMATFIADAAIHGRDSWYWKLGNVVLHFACGLVIFLLSRSLLSFSTLTERYGDRQLALFSMAIAALWLFHPLQVSTVLYTVQRMTVLSSLFILLGLLSFSIGVKRNAEGRNGGWLLLVSALLCFPLALLSKESGALYPVFALLISRMWIAPWLALNNGSVASAARRNIRLHDGLMWLLIVAGILLLLAFPGPLFLDGYAFRPFSLTERLLTESRVLFLYLLQILLPIPANLGFFHDDFQISTGLLEPLTTLLAVVALVSIAGALYWMRKREPLVVVGLLFFFASQLMESTIIPLELVFEHRTYLGSWGVILALSAVLLRFRYGLLLLFSLSVLLAGMTAHRVSFWSDPGSMYRHMLDAHPQSLRLRIIFADAYAVAGKYDQAVAYLADQQGLGVALQRLTIVCDKEGVLGDGDLSKTLQGGQRFLGTYELEGIINLANQGLDEKCRFDHQEFIGLLDDVVEYPVKDASGPQKLLLYKAHFLHGLDDRTAAIAALEESFQRDISNPIPLFLMLEWQLEYGQFIQARQTFARARKAAGSAYRYEEFVERAKELLVDSNLSLPQDVR